MFQSVYRNLAGKNQFFWGGSSVFGGFVHEVSPAFVPKIRLSKMVPLAASGRGAVNQLLHHLPRHRPAPRHRQAAVSFLVFYRMNSSISTPQENSEPAGKVQEARPAPLPEKSEFFRYLRQRIKATGAISVAEYMKECLTNPYYGYYSRKNPIGRQGDFITSPEVCQIFGELVALWCVNEWSIAKSPTPLQIIELGPGTGTLAWDMLRIFKSFPQLKDSVSLHLVERSPEMARLQAEKLGIQSVNQTASLSGSASAEQPASVPLPPITANDSTDTPHFQHGVSQFGIPVFWYQRIQDIPKAPAFIIANEFFDALPVHKLQRTEKGDLREVLVDVVDDVTEGVTDDVTGPRLRFVLSPTETAPLRIIPKESRGRSHLELSLEGGVVLDDIADRVADCGGGALVIDYGHDGTKNDTFRAFYKHKVVDPLGDPGQCDLTTDVDFSLLRQLLKKKCVSFGPISQSQFLFHMSFEQRFNALMKACRTDEEKERLAAACDVLINPAKMGGQFFAFAVFGWKRARLGPVTGGFV